MEMKNTILNVQWKSAFEQWLLLFNGKFFENEHTRFLTNFRYYL